MNIGSEAHHAVIFLLSAVNHLLLCSSGRPGTIED
jgi:hypothetical protein